MKLVLREHEVALFNGLRRQAGASRARAEGMRREAASLQREAEELEADADATVRAMIATLAQAHGAQPPTGEIQVAREGDGLALTWEAAIPPVPVGEDVALAGAPA